MTITKNGSRFYRVEGAVPSGVQGYYSTTDYSFADVINILAGNGFELVFADSWGSDSNNNERVVYMSKSGTPQTNAAPEIYDDDDSEATEVARYNMQGLPVNENEKGVQIVVYSNFTAKVIIVQ